ncbi:hypothetical protein HDU92_006426 [Lobulomyces angularis]|nr:hypothetical protein HDU92_006426 [Lobulomyces angularis]
MHNSHRPKPRHPVAPPVKDSNGDTIVFCFNCSTKNTPLWRRDSCGNILKLHHEHRPLSLKTDTIRKRQRYPNNFENESLNENLFSSKKIKK